MSDQPLKPPVKIGRVILKTQAASLLNDPTRAMFGRELLPTDEVLARRGGRLALTIYEDLERDPMVAACLQKRRLALVSREWRVEPGEDTPAGKAVAELVGETLRGIAFDRAVEDFLSALLLGLSILEVVWEDRGDRLVPAALLARNPRRFTFRLADDGWIDLRLLTKGSGSEGVAVDDRKFVVHRFGGRYGDPWGLGLGHRLFWAVYFKRQGISFWMGALEKFGQPTVVGKYPNGTTEPDQDKLLQAVTAVSTDAGVTIPDGMLIELLEAKRSGSFDSYERLCSYFDAEISKVILGETLTTSTAANGNRALGEVHNQVRLEITKADADGLSGTLNASLVRWIVELNATGYAGAMPRMWWRVEEAEDLNRRADRDKAILALGYEPLPDYIAETYGQGWVKKQAAPLPPGLNRLAGVPPAAAFAAAGQAPVGFVPEILLGERLNAALAPVLDEWLGQIEAMVMKATSLQEVAEGLLKLYPTMRAEQLASAMQQAMQVAQLVGRAELVDGVG